MQSSRITYMALLARMHAVGRPAASCKVEIPKALHQSKISRPLITCSASVVLSISKKCARQSSHWKK